VSQPARGPDRASQGLLARPWKAIHMSVGLCGRHPCRSPRDRPSAKVSRPGPRRPVPPRSGD
jgi:hypothetical protein